jgi:hypothetical protein
MPSISAWRRWPARRAAPTTALAREAILEYIDDLEDCRLAEARARRHCKTIPLEDVERELGP